MSDQPEIKPCLFCGTENVGVRSIGPHTHVVCRLCGAQGPDIASELNKGTPAVRLLAAERDAIDQWNDHMFSGVITAGMIHTGLQEADVIAEMAARCTALLAINQDDSTRQQLDAFLNYLTEMRLRVLATLPPAEQAAVETGQDIPSIMLRGRKNNRRKSK